MKYIVYSTVCTVNNKIYIGVHKTINPDVFDGYIGNGININKPNTYKKSKTPFQYAVNCYGIDKFKRTILQVFDTAEEAFKLEAELVTEEFVKRTDNYNLKVGGEGGCSPTRLVKVYMYDLEGNFVQEFESAFDCNRYFDINAKNGSAVLKAIRLGQTLHGYQFSKEKLPFMKKYIPTRGSHNNKRKIGRFDDNGNLLEEYESLSACRKQGYQNASHSVRNGRKCKGFYFKYLD